MNIDERDELNILEKNKNYFPQTFESTVHHFYLSSYIESPEEYHRWFDIIRNCDANSVVYIHINCYGGDTFTSIQLMRVLKECEGTVICSVEGACMSGATFIFLSGDIFQVSQHSMFMFHNYSGQAIGKGHEMYDDLMHSREWSTKLLTDTYKGFLDDKEITQLLDGRDLYMGEDEVVSRLSKLGKEVHLITGSKKAEEMPKKIAPAKKKSVKVSKS